MFTPQGNMEGWLKELGQARSQGAFAVSSGRFPWQKPEPKVLNFLHRRLAWARVAATFAAAAGVAVLFVGPSFIHSHGIPSGLSGVVSPLTPESSGDGQAVPSILNVRVECDYNGDGVVDGREIQALVDLVNRGNGGDPADLAKSIEKLNHCLLERNS